MRLFIDAGRQHGVRPADIVGAVAGEADIPGEAIGAIDIYERFTFVEVPAAYAEQVVERMRGTTLRSRRVTVKLARPQGGGMRPSDRRPGRRLPGRAPGKPPRRRRIA